MASNCWTLVFHDPNLQVWTQLVELDNKTKKNLPIFGSLPFINAEISQNDVNCKTKDHENKHMILMMLMQLSFSQYHLETKNHDNEHMMIMEVCLQKLTTKHKTMTTNAS
jgi:hypothetical protein